MKWQFARLSEPYDKNIGPFVESNHGVNGSVHIIDSKTIKISHFSYDGKKRRLRVVNCCLIIRRRYLHVINTLISMFFLGKAPDAFFFVGTSLPVDELNGGILVPYPGNSTEKLTMHDGADVFISLPGNLDTSDLKWLSIWSKNISVSLGHVEFLNASTPTEGKE